MGGLLLVALARAGFRPEREPGAGLLGASDGCRPGFLDAGFSHTCAMVGSGQLHCWGRGAER